jgi:hypothetical protein
MSFIIDADVHLPLLRAYPHQWGPGKVHQIDCEQTFCGKLLRSCPGEKFKGFHDEITCEVCLKSRESRAKWAEWEKNYARQQEEARRAQQAQQPRQMSYDERQRQWQSDYREYLSSPIWLGKRARVLQRADGMCEGCGCRRAWQVHHLRYPKNCRPGSDDWIRQEKLFDLRAICRECHEDVHQR